MGRLQRLVRRADDLLWQADAERLRGPLRWALLALRIAATLVADLQRDEITLRAMSLVYTTLVSLVPLLALAFSLLKAFGVNHALRPVLERFLSPLGPGSTQIVDRIVAFVQNVQVGVLGAAGVVLLLYSVISLVQKVEAGCNAIWLVKRARPLGRRISEYLAVLVAGPLVIVAATSLTAAGAHGGLHVLSTLPGLASLLWFGAHVLPYLLYSIGFTLLYEYLPNTSVRIGPAIGGGVFAGVLWQTASLTFTVFARNAGNVNAIYSSFAILILLLIWLYVSWLIVLAGCRVAFLLQHPERLTYGPYPPRFSPAESERVAVLTAALVAHRFIHGQTPWTVEALGRALRVAPEQIESVTARLISAGVLLEIDAYRARLMPCRDIADVRVDDVVAAVRAVERRTRARPRVDGLAEAVDPLLARGDRARAAIYAQTSLRTLALSLDAEAANPDAADAQAAS